MSLTHMHVGRRIRGGERAGDDYHCPKPNEEERRGDEGGVYMKMIVPNYHAGEEKRKGDLKGSMMRIVPNSHASEEEKRREKGE